MPEEFRATARRIIYDLGANVGDDIPYYLKKADLVVAVEANPTLCSMIRTRFSAEIENGKLVVENVVVSSTQATDRVPFYIHRNHNAHSQFPKPEPSRIAEFEEMLLPSMAVCELIKQWGSPFYVKIDLEYYDGEILRALFDENIFPPFLSAESHDVEVFALMVACGKYDAFKLVEGNTIEERFKNHSIKVKNGTEPYTFLDSSAGPFGEDIPGDWLTANDFLPFLGNSGLGWKDIHATNAISAKPAARNRLRRTLYDVFSSAAKRLVQ